MLCLVFQNTWQTDGKYKTYNFKAEYQFKKRVKSVKDFTLFLYTILFFSSSAIFRTLCNKVYMSVRFSKAALIERTHQTAPYFQMIPFKTTFDVYSFYRLSLSPVTPRRSTWPVSVL